MEYFKHGLLLYLSDTASFIKKGFRMTHSKLDDDHFKRRYHGPVSRYLFACLYLIWLSYGFHNNCMFFYCRVWLAPKCRDINWQACPPAISQCLNAAGLSDTLWLSSSAIHFSEQVLACLFASYSALWQLGGQWVLPLTPAPPPPPPALPLWSSQRLIVWVQEQRAKGKVPLPSGPRPSRATQAPLSLPLSISFSLSNSTCNIESGLTRSPQTLQNNVKHTHFNHSTFTILNTTTHPQCFQLLF